MTAVFVSYPWKRTLQMIQGVFLWISGWRCVSLNSLTIRRHDHFIITLHIWEFFQLSLFAGWWVFPASVCARCFSSWSCALDKCIFAVFCSTLFAFLWPFSGFVQFTFVCMCHVSPSSCSCTSCVLFLFLWAWPHYTALSHVFLRGKTLCTSFLVVVT